MYIIRLFLVPVCCCLHLVRCCDLEHFFSEKQVSVEESARTAQVIFRGLSTVAATPPTLADLQGIFTAYFELINTYKGAESFDIWDATNFRY